MRIAGISASLTALTIAIGGLALTAAPAQAAPGDCRISKTLTTGYAGCDRGTPGFIQVVISCTGEATNRLGPKISAGSGVRSALSCPSGKYVDFVGYNYYAS